MSPDPTTLDDALDRANRLRQRAISCRHAMAIAHTLEFRTVLASQTAKFDAEADEIMAAMKDDGDG